jgi:uncharacterized protein HemX
MSRNCVVRSGDALNLDDSDAQSEQFLANCLTEPGARLRLTLPSETEKMPDTTSNAVAPAAPAAKRAPAIQHEVTSPDLTEALSQESAAPALPAAVEAPAASEELHATTQAAAEPANAAPDLSQIQGLAGGNPIVTVILALIVVGGGTAGWKFWQKKSEQNHELAMKKVDMELELAGLSGAQPPPCQTASVKLNGELSEIRGDLKANGEAHKKLQEQIDDIAERLGKLEKKASSMFSGGFDPEEMEERVAKIEKALKAEKGKAKKS